MASLISTDPSVFRSMIQPDSEFSYAQEHILIPGCWNPELMVMDSSTPVKLCILDFVPLKIAGLCFRLKPKYKVDRVLPRSYYGIICSICIQGSHSFVFNIKQHETPFFQELGGLRQVLAFNIEYCSEY